MATAAICTLLFSFSTRLYLRQKEIDPMNRETPSYPTKQILRWSKLDKPTSSSSSSSTTIMTGSSLSVALVTQCSFDRLSNLYHQLFMWNGKASIAVFLKPSTSPEEAQKEIISKLEQTRQQAIEKHGRKNDDANNYYNDWDVSVTLVFGNDEKFDEYPVNYLRNVALIDAKSQQQQIQRRQGVKGAVFLVDVDFRPSLLLHEVLLSSSAANAIIDQHQIIIVPAFEGLIDSSLPETVVELKEQIDSGAAAGFQLYACPLCHGPTNYKKYWEHSLIESSNANDRSLSVDDIWEGKYNVSYKKLFEPYIVMATENVPLYDERFNGWDYNKIAHIFSIAALARKKKHDWSWGVLPGVFLFHVKHKVASDWKLRDKKPRYNPDPHDHDLYLHFKKGILYHNGRIVMSKATEERLELLRKNSG